MRITDKNVIKAVEVHTIMASDGWVYTVGDNLKLVSLSPHHTSVLTIKNFGKLNNRYTTSYTIDLYTGLQSPYWKAKSFIEFHEDDKLHIVTDFGEAIVEKTSPLPALPTPPDDVFEVNMWRFKNNLSKVLKTKNYKRPKTAQKYVVFREGVSDAFTLPFSFDGEVKSSTLLQALEVAWRAKKNGFMGVIDDLLYINAGGDGLIYEGFVKIRRL